MANLINKQLGNMQNLMTMQGQGGMPDFRSMLQNPQVKQQMREMYKKYNGDTNALIFDMIKQNPAFANNPILQTAQMAMSGMQNSNGILGTLGISEQDFTNIFHGK